MKTTEQLFSSSTEWNSFHDAVFEIDQKSRTESELQELFNVLPTPIRDTAHANGLSDTVFRDEAYVYLKTNSRLLDKTQRDLEHYIAIGFCQPKFYKPHVWRKAKGLMEWLCDHTPHVERFNFGRGKGKYHTTGEWEKLDLWKEVIPGLAKLYIQGH